MFVRTTLCLAICAAFADASCTNDVVKLVAVNGTLPEPRACVQQADQLIRKGLISGCTAQNLREACNGLDHPNIFGCSDVTGSGCAVCYDHAVA
jgi:hypothetical protein